MAAESGSDARCGIGARLRAARERAGMTVLQAAERLHIDSRMLEALEAERFEAFGAPVFVLGHLRNYAELIGERFAELQALYAAATRTPLPDLTKAPRAPRPFDRSKLVKPMLVMTVGVALASAVWWVLTRRLG